MYSQQFPCLATVEEGRCQADCCGIIPMDVGFWEQHKDQAAVDPTEILNIDPYQFINTVDDKCVFLHREHNICCIYTSRPDVCIQFGMSNHPVLACPYIAPSGEKRRRAERRELQRRMCKRKSSQAGKIRRLGPKGPMHDKV